MSTSQEFIILDTFLVEGWENQREQELDRVREQAHSMGLEHKGKNAWGRPGQEGATHLESNGQLMPIRKNHPIQSVLRKMGRDKQGEMQPTPQPPQQPTPPAAGPTPIATSMNRGQIEQYQADFINLSSKMKQGKIDPTIAKKIGQGLVDKGQIKKRVKGTKVAFLADEGKSGIPRNFPRKYGAFLQTLEGLGVDIPEVENVEAVSGASSPYSPSKIFVGVGETKSTKADPKLKKNSIGNVTGYTIGEHSESINEELASMFPVASTADADVLENVSVDKIRQTKTWKKFREQLVKDHKELSAETVDRISDDHVSAEIAKNRRVQVISNSLIKRDGELKGRFFIKSDGISLVNNLLLEFEKEKMLSPDGKEKVKKIVEEIKGVLLQDKEFEDYNKLCAELVDTLMKEKGYKHLAPLTETLCIMSAMVNHYDVVVPDDKSFPVADYVAFSNSDTGKMVQVLFGNVKYGIGGSTSIAPRLYLSSLQGYVSSDGKYTNGVSVLGKMLNMASEPRKIWSEVNVDETVAREHTNAFVKEFEDLFFEHYDVDVPPIKRNAVLKQIMSCWGNGVHWDKNDPTACTDRETSFPSGVETDACKKAWKIFRTRGMAMEIINNTLQLAEEYASQIMQPKTGIVEIDGRRKSSLDFTETGKHSGFKFVGSPGNVTEFEKGCKMPASGYSVRTIENNRDYRI